MLLRDGADFTKIDKVMERKFGWPMGPAYLLGCCWPRHSTPCTSSNGARFPERMGKEGRDAIDALYAAEKYGQKNGCT